MTDDEKAALADVYERAAEYLEEYGWIQFSMTRSNGAACMAGACYLTGCGHMFDTALRFICKTMELEGDTPTQAIGRWNDSKGRTKDEIINTLHALANKLR